MSKLAVQGGQPILPTEGSHFVWPRITPEIKERVLNQLDTSLSIYNRSGIFEVFEDKFAAYHDRKFALLTNSGTTALHSMFVAANLKEGDEVICPAYTFFASVTPLLFTGAKPILCDSDSNGNISPEEVEKHITSNTKAVLVTHMWGVPVQMAQLKKICEAHNLLLLEDCSHAHGATYGGNVVGSEGDIAAWSLQGSKTVTGGEGGILVMDNEEFYYRGLSLGHYNKRCKNEIPKEHFLSEFAVTGMGLKYRAHPLAIAIADEIFDHLDDVLRVRRMFAKKILTALQGYDALVPPTLTDVEPSFYALTFQYKKEVLDGLPLDVFLEALHKEGLVEMDHPGSTQPLNLLPLFQKPETLFDAYTENGFSYAPGEFPHAEDFYHNALKMPVGSYEDEAEIVDAYISGIIKVLDNYKELL